LKHIIGSLLGYLLLLPVLPKIGIAYQQQWEYLETAGEHEERAEPFAFSRQRRP
jgi:hypothetical protein